ncbi:Subtilase family protein [Filimonas lacunae]|uniref:Subtilase family protein n=1 Tax=Filimonas lacunae TaxID=477680 RepID=A0A173MLN0_9BACT|nr:S8 family peptidase [Filimonas lacunae]BAV08369.1 protease precursor [Filimonas lacunae]SIT33464.1 Subtilase family protein [Filimonas lacunae]
MKKWNVLLAICGTLTIAHAQMPNWQNLDLQKDSVFGISTERAYNELLKNKKGTKVIVAVIDSGVDTAHEDLKSVLWINAKEKAGNNKDDDRNHYADDINGWSFIGSDKGNVVYDNLELTRIIRKQQARFGSLNSVPEDTTGLGAYKQLRTEYDRQLLQAEQQLKGVTQFATVLDSLVAHIGKTPVTLADLKAYKATNGAEARIKGILEQQLERYPDVATFKEREIQGALDHFKELVDYQLNLSYDSRPVVGDDYNNVTQRYYGSSDVCGPDADHGTHVAGIIGGIRHNGLGIDGIDDQVQIMAVRAVPNGDERDKDIANAIRYAADNGAKVINMSFGKPYSPDKKEVDDAVKYALSKDILFIHAAGNDGENIDSINVFYPRREFLDGTVANAWIEVGASGMADDENLVASFSNYGKNTVDVFAPGVAIYSSVPGSKYAYHDGTSMAAPVVSGLAALIRSYYPNLTAVQVKDIILKSAVPVKHPVAIAAEGNEEPAMVSMLDLCRTGGVVNAYYALKMAAGM